VNLLRWLGHALRPERTMERTTHAELSVTAGSPVVTVVQDCPDCGVRGTGVYEQCSFAGVTKWWFCDSCQVGIPANEHGELIKVVA
jgi:hypothetical protein